MADEAAAMALAEPKPKGSSGGNAAVVDRAKARFKVAVEAETENRAKQLDDLKFLAASPDDNYQWPKDVYTARTMAGQEGGARPCLTINKLPQHHRQVTNEQRMNRPQIIVRPADSKGSKEVAKVLNGWIRHVQVASEAALAYDLACDSQVGCGDGYFRVLTDYCDERSFDQDVVFAPLPDRFKVYMDPVGLLQHPAGRKCRWAFIIEDLPKDEYEFQYEDKPIDWNDRAIGDAEWFPNKNTVRVAEYFEIEEKKKKLYLFRVGDDLVSMVEGERTPPGVVAGMKPVKERDTTVPQCRWYKLNGQGVIEERDMPTKYIPVIRVVGNQYIIEGKPIVSGIVRNAKDAQRMYNYNASLDVELNGLAPRSPFVGMLEQFKGHEDRWKYANQRNYAFLPYNAIRNDDGTIAAVSPPARVQPAMPNAAVIQAKLAAADDIKSTTGQYNASLGQQSNETSGKAIMARQREGDVGTFHYIDNLALALRYAGTIALDMAPTIIDTKRIVRILGEDGEPDHVTVDPNQDVPVKEVVDRATGKKTKTYNLTLGKYEVVVNTGPSFTTKRQEAAEFLTSAVQSAKDPATANVLTYLALKNQDWAGAEEAVTMLKKLLPPNVMPDEDGEGDPMAELPPEVLQAVEQLKGNVGQLAGQLEAAKQALAERDGTLKDLQGQIKGKNVEAMAKMYEADKKAMAEIEKARADVLIARANAVTAMAAQPQNTELQAVVQGLDQIIGEMGAKLEALAASTAAIAEQLQTFEIAGRMPAQDIATPQVMA
jgi:hypothetical protein